MKLLGSVEINKLFRAVTSRKPGALAYASEESPNGDLFDEERNTAATKALGLARYVRDIISCFYRVYLCAREHSQASIIHLHWYNCTVHIQSLERKERYYDPPVGV